MKHFCLFLYQISNSRIRFYHYHIIKKLNRCNKLNKRKQREKKKKKIPVLLKNTSVSAHLVFFFSLSLKYQILKFHFKTKSSCVCLVSNGCTVFYMFECHKSSRKSNDIFCEYFLFPGNKHTA